MWLDVKGVRPQRGLFSLLLEIYWSFLFSIFNMSGISLGSWHSGCPCGSHPGLVLHALSPQKTVWLQIFWCNCVILYLSCSSFIPKFINHLFKCKPISMVGAEQVRRSRCIGCHIWWLLGSRNWGWDPAALWGWDLEEAGFHLSPAHRAY